MSRERTRATLYVSVRVAGEPVRRFLLPPRLATLSVPLVGSAVSQTSAKHVDGDGDEEPLFATRTPGDDIDTSRLPAPGEPAGICHRWPPASICIGWAVEGARHLLGGLDHLLFLAALALAARSLGILGLLVTAFSAGHMTTMAMAIAGQWPRLAAVEVAIGVTIGWSAWQARRAPASRSTLGLAVGAALSGLIHGAAFGAELRAVVGSSDGLLWPVLSFGVGLDLAQTAAAGLVFASWTPVRRLLAKVGNGPQSEVAATRGVGASKIHQVAAGALVAAGVAYAVRGFMTAI